MLGYIPPFIFITYIYIIIITELFKEGFIFVLGR